MNLEIVIVYMNRQLDGISTTPDELNTLNYHLPDIKDAPCDPPPWPRYMEFFPYTA